jgi:hypothetical protein
MITLLYLTMASNEAVPARALRGDSFSWGPRWTSGGGSVYLDTYTTK